MRQEKSLIALLQGLVALLAEEHARNPAFAERVDSLLADVPGPKAKAARARKTPEPLDLPDVHAEWTARGEAGFRLWLQDQPVTVLKAIIRAEDLDATRRAAKWTKAEKLAAFIAEGIAGRATRGAAFMRAKT
jgi:hypothetical protein